MFAEAFITVLGKVWGNNSDAKCTSSWMEGPRVKWAHGRHSRGRHNPQRGPPSCGPPEGLWRKGRHRLASKGPRANHGQSRPITANHAAASAGWGVRIPATTRISCAAPDDGLQYHLLTGRIEVLDLGEGMCTNGQQPLVGTHFNITSIEGEAGGEGAAYWQAFIGAQQHHGDHQPDPRELQGGS
jgi:hypothetical protein